MDILLYSLIPALFSQELPTGINPASSERSLPDYREQDTNQNRIDDLIEAGIANGFESVPALVVPRTNDQGQQEIDVVVTYSSPPMPEAMNSFRAVGGTVIKELRHALYGWTGSIPVASIHGFVERADSAFMMISGARKGSTATIALPPLTVAAVKVAGEMLIDLSVRSTTGAPLDTDEALRLEITYSAEVNATAANWKTLQEPWTLAGGALCARVPLLAERARFIRVREKP